MENGRRIYHRVLVFNDWCCYFPDSGITDHFWTDMTGRSRKSGPRYPSGERKLEGSLFHPVAIKRLADAAIARVSDPKWGTPLGRMFLEGKLNAAEYGAGMRWDELRRAYLVAIDASSPNPRSAALELGRSQQPDPDSFVGIRMMKQHIAAVKDFVDASKVLSEQGTYAASVVRFLCEDAMRVATHDQYLAAKKALGALAQYFADKS